MSATRMNRGNKKVYVSDNVYTAILGFALGVVLATAGYVAYSCYFEYGTLFSIPQSIY
jgi:hypothetical protein